MTPTPTPGPPGPPGPPGTPGGAERPAVACTLGGGEVGHRVDEWRRLVATATGVTRHAAGVRLTFDPSPAVAADLARLCALEAACCAFFTFEVVIAAASVRLSVTAPVEAAALVEQLFGCR